MDNGLRISTITSILRLSHNIDLKSVYECIPISDYIPYIEYGSDNPARGFSEKSLKKKRKKKKKKIFYNQATIHVFHNKLINVKLFNNGRIQVTGLKSEDHGYELISQLILYLQDFEVFTMDVKIEEQKIVLINSDFDIGMQVDRDKVHNEIIDRGIYSSYEPCIYPGVNIKYYINYSRENGSYNGICRCESMCNGKGNACGDGDCKKVTIAIFKSGKVIITGGQNKSQINESYRFISNFILDQKDKFLLK